MTLSERLEQSQANKSASKTGKKSPPNFEAPNSANPSKHGAGRLSDNSTKPTLSVSNSITPNNHSKDRLETTNKSKPKHQSKLGQIGATLEQVAKQNNLELHAITIMFDEHKSRDFLSRANSTSQTESATQYYSRQINKQLKKESINLFTYAFDLSKEKNLVHIHGVIATQDRAQALQVAHSLSKLLRKSGAKPTPKQTNVQEATNAAGFLGYAINTFNSKAKQHLKQFHTLTNIGKLVKQSQHLTNEVNKMKQEKLTNEAHLNAHQGTETPKPMQSQ